MGRLPRRRRVTATAGLDAQIKRGPRAVRMLNAILASQLASDPERLAARNSVWRVQVTPGGTGGSATVDITPLPKIA